MAAFWMKATVEKNRDPSCVIEARETLHPYFNRRRPKGRKSPGVVADFAR